MLRNQRSAMTIWRILTIAFGAAPVTVLLVPASMGVFYGSLLLSAALYAAKLESIMLGALMVVWGGLGVFGVLSLWAVSIDYPARSAKIGLAMGTGAILPLTVLTALGRPPFDGVDILFFVLLLVLPPIVALGWLIAPGRHTSVQAPGIEDIANEAPNTGR